MILCDCVVRRELGSFTDFFHLIFVSTIPCGALHTLRVLKDSWTFSSILMATDLKRVRTTYIDSIGSDFIETSKLFLVWSLFDLIYIFCVYIYIYIFFSIGGAGWGLGHVRVKYYLIQ